MPRHDREQHSGLEIPGDVAFQMILKLVFELTIDAALMEKRA